MQRGNATTVGVDKISQQSVLAPTGQDGGSSRMRRLSVRQVVPAIGRRTHGVATEKHTHTHTDTMSAAGSRIEHVLETIGAADAATTAN